MLIFEKTPFLYFGHISVKISPNNNKLDSFKIYAERAVENVQDGTYRCFGGREINKTKVETILWDTMYDQAQNGKIVAEDRKTNRKTGTLGHA